MKYFLVSILAATSLSAFAFTQEEIDSTVAKYNKGLGFKNGVYYRIGHEPADPVAPAATPVAATFPSDDDINNALADLRSGRWQFVHPQYSDMVNLLSGAMDDPMRSPEGGASPSAADIKDALSWEFEHTVEWGMTMDNVANTDWMQADWSKIDVAGFLAGDPYMLMGYDLSTFKGLTVAGLSGVGWSGLVGTRLPAMDLTGWLPTGWQLTGADLSLTTGLSVDALSALSPMGCYSGDELAITKLGAMNLAGWVPTDERLIGVDMSLTSGLSVAALTSYTEGAGWDTALNQAKLPPIDISMWVPTGQILGGVDLSLTRGMTMDTLSTYLANGGLLSGYNPLGVTMQGTKLPAMDLTGWVQAGSPNSTLVIK